VTNLPAVQQGTPSGPGSAPTAPQAPAPFEFSAPFEDEHLNGLIYGEYGVGKSTIAASAADVPTMQDVLYIAAEAGEKVLVPYAQKGHLTVVRVSKYATVARIYEWLVLHTRYRDAGDLEKLAQLEAKITGKVPEVPKQFRTVVLDSLTEIQVYLMYQLLGITIGGTRLDLPPDSPEFKEWGQSSEMIKLLIRSFRDLRLNVIIVCSMEEKEDEKKRQLKRLLLPGKLATNVQGFLDFVGYLDKAKTDTGYAWRLHLTSGQTFHAKNRFGPTAPAYIDKPDMTKLYQLNLTSTPTPQETPSNGTSSTAAGPKAGSSSEPTRPAAGSAGAGVRGPVRVGGDRGPVRSPGR
jgi:hypothetical protein